MKKLVVGLILGALALSGCSTAGPYVTNISSDGTGGLIVEKCMIHYNPMGWVNNSDCTNTTIKVEDTNRK